MKTDDLVAAQLRVSFQDFSTGSDLLPAREEDEDSPWLFPGVDPPEHRHDEVQLKGAFIQLPHGVHRRLRMFALGVGELAVQVLVVPCSGWQPFTSLAIAFVRSRTATSRRLPRQLGDDVLEEVFPHAEGPTRSLHYRALLFAAKVGAQARHVEGRGHHDDAEVRRATDEQRQERQQQVRVHVPGVRLVHNDVRSPELAQARQEGADGAEADGTPGPRRPLVPADHVPHGAVVPPLPAHTLGQRDCRQATGLRADDVAGRAFAAAHGLVQQVLRHLRGFARASLGCHQSHLLGAHGLQELVLDRADWEPGALAQSVAEPLVPILAVLLELRILARAVCGIAIPGLEVLGPGRPGGIHRLAVEPSIVFVSSSIPRVVAAFHHDLRHQLQGRGPCLHGRGRRSTV
mmetsp:Transcript_128947/g.412946  ORF Transcript_128947/g.412946 Transcript_128947/m.412946 type:complete len:403 (+) Transcript_128947:1972-3180(+)